MVSGITTWAEVACQHCGDRIRVQRADFCEFSMPMYRILDGTGFSVIRNGDDRFVLCQKCAEEWDEMLSKGKKSYEMFYNTDFHADNGEK